MCAGTWHGERSLNRLKVRVASLSDTLRGVGDPRALCWLWLRPGQLLALLAFPSVQGLGAFLAPLQPPRPPRPRGHRFHLFRITILRRQEVGLGGDEPPPPPRSPTPGRRQRLLVLNHSFFHPPGPGAAAEAGVAEGRGFPQRLWLHSRALGGHLVQGLGARDPLA